MVLLNNDEVRRRSRHQLPIKNTFETITTYAVYSFIVSNPVNAVDFKRPPHLYRNFQTMYVFLVKTTSSRVFHLITNYPLRPPSHPDDGHDRPVPRPGKPALPEPDEYKCLIRATSGSRKLSTVVGQTDVPRIMESYAKIMKTSMDGLKKVKKIKNKTKASG